MAFELLSKQSLINIQALWIEIIKKSLYVFFKNEVELIIDSLNI